MGFGRFLKTLVSPSAMVEEIVRLQELAYREAADRLEGADPHVLLAYACLSRMAARGGVDPRSPNAEQQAFHKTWQFALIPWPKNVRAFGLHLASEERPEIFQMAPQYHGELESLLSPGLRATQNGTFFALYEQMNPQTQYIPTKETGTGWFFGPKV